MLIESSLLKLTNSLANGGKRGGSIFARSPVSFAKLWKNKSDFMLKTFGILIVQLLVTFFIMYKLSESEKFNSIIEKNKIAYLLFILFVPLIIIIILAFVPMPIYMKVILFTLFSITFGISLAVIKKHVPPEIVKTALMATIGIFVALFVIGIMITMMGYNLWWLGAILLVLLIFAIISGVVMIFTNPSQKAIRIRAGIIVGLFVIFILYDTNQILQRDYRGDFVTAAIDYYLDIINIFVHMIQVLSNSN